jgi:large subunit ribosomal protein L4
MKIAIKNIEGKKQGDLEVKFPLVEDGKGTQAVHDTVVAYRAGQRMGTACTKNVGEVAGTNKKPWRQKGTGRARAGSFQSPLWRGGGVVFGPRPRDYTINVPKKVKALAFRKALSERMLAGDLIVVDDLKLASHKTKEFAVIMATIGAKNGPTLVVTDQVDENLKLASRNLADVQVEPVDSLNTYELLRFEKIVATKSALEKLRARLTKD